MDAPSHSKRSRPQKVPQKRQDHNPRFDLRVLHHSRDDRELVVRGVTADTPVSEVRQRLAKQMGTRADLIGLTHTLGTLEDGKTLGQQGFVDGQRGVALSNSV